MLVGHDVAPGNLAGLRGQAHGLELLLAGLVVAHVVVVDAAGTVAALSLHEDGHRHRRARPLAEDVIPLLTPFLPRRTRVPTQVKHEHIVELLVQAGAEPVEGVATDPAAVAHEGHHALLAHAVARPAERPDVGVVERVLVRGVGLRHVGFGDPCVERGVGIVLVVVVGALLAHRVGRVAHDHADGQGVLDAHAVGVVAEHLLVEGVALLGHLERVGEHGSLEGLVGAARARVVGLLDVHRHDVVRQQQDLVGVDLLGVLAPELLRGDQVALDEVRHEGPRPREGVQDVHAVVGQGLAELAAQHPVGLAQDVVDYLGGGVHHAHLVGGALERDLEEALVEVTDKLLARDV